MSKRNAHSDALRGILSRPDEVTGYLIANCNLPGPRANLELVHAFGDAVAQLPADDVVRAWKLCLEMSKISEAEAPVNSQREFLPLCGTVGLGVLGATNPALLRDSMKELQRLARDGRWRTREGVATSLQRMMAIKPALMRELATWVTDEDWLEMRAVAAGVAEPPLLRNRALAETALELHRKIFARVARASVRGSAEFKTLRQALGFTLSVVVAALGDEAVRYMEELSSSKDPDVRRVVKENLKKERLKRAYPKQVKAMERRLSGPS